MDAASSGYSVAECLKVEAMSPVWCLAVDDGLIVAGCGDGSVEVGGSVTIFSHLRLCYFLSFPSEENRKHFCFRFSSDLTFPETPITRQKESTLGVIQVSQRCACCIWRKLNFSLSFRLHHFCAVEMTSPELGVTRFTSTL